MRLILTTCVLLVGWACGSNKTAQSSATDFAGLETGGCFGWCPVYKLTFRTDGNVRYEGIRNVAKPGAAEVRLTKKETAQLQKAVKDANLAQYPDRIKSNIQDAAGATLVAYENGSSKRVFGTIDRPKPLIELQNLMATLVERHGISLQGVQPPPPPKSELIVKLKPEVNAGNWLMQFQELKLRLVRRIATENIWLVAYDAQEIDEKGLIELFKAHDAVLEAQPNREVKERH